MGWPPKDYFVKIVAQGEGGRKKPAKITSEKNPNYLLRYTPGVSRNRSAA